MDYIIERIRKLLALANDRGATEAEAVVAMSKAHDLLAEHNLTMASVGGRKVAEESVLIDQSELTRTYDPWVRFIWNACADLYFARYFWTRVRLGSQHYGLQHTVVGSKDNVEATKLMASWLVSTVRRLGRQHSKRWSKQHAFQLGCSIRLQERIKAKKVAAQQSSSLLPVLYDSWKTKIDEAVKVGIKLSGRKPKNQRYRGHATSFDAGYQEGDYITIDKELVS